jgi:hypothetical protein
MKVPISDYALIDLDAPVLPAYEAVVKGHPLVSVVQVLSEMASARGRRGASGGALHGQQQPVLEDGIQLGVRREVEA